jgi:hypothetical protein
MRYSEFANEPLINHKIKYPVISVDSPETDSNMPDRFDFEMAWDLEFNKQLNVETAILKKGFR